jgi:hypothetical protein
MIFVVINKRFTFLNHYNGKQRVEIFHEWEVSHILLMIEKKLGQIDHDCNILTMLHSIFDKIGVQGPILEKSKIDDVYVY